MSRDGRKTGGRNFKPGNKASPGRPRLPEEVKEARRLNQVEFDRACGKLFFMSLDDLKELVSNPKTNTLEALIGRILVKGIQESSKAELNYFVERFLGKVPENINNNFSGNMHGGLMAFIHGGDRPAEIEDEE